MLVDAWKLQKRFV